MKWLEAVCCDIMLKNACIQRGGGRFDNRDIMLLFIICFGSSVVATMLFDKITRCSLSVFRFVISAICFALFINMLMYAALYLWGIKEIVWSTSLDFAEVLFCVKYMGLSLVFACLLAWLAGGLAKLTVYLKKKTDGDENKDSN